MRLTRAVAPTASERAEDRPGDEVVPAPDVVMDRAFTVSGRPADVWPWLAQLGKGRAGWYLPARLERALPARNRALRHVDDAWTRLAVGDVVPDYGGRDASFTVAAVDAPHHLVYHSRRGRTTFSWSIVLRAAGERDTRVLLRLRMAPVRRRRLAATAGEALDLLTVAGMAAGLRDRLPRP